jgi:hypothetical protein
MSLMFALSPVCLKLLIGDRGGAKPPVGRASLMRVIFMIGGLFFFDISNTLGYFFAGSTDSKVLET